MLRPRFHKLSAVLSLGFLIGCLAPTIHAQDSAGPTATATASIQVVNDVPTFVTLTLPDAATHAPYSQALQVTGGVAPYTFSLVGTLPAGLNLSPTTGVISGTPTTTGSSTFTVQVKDSASQTATQVFTLKVNVGIAPGGRNSQLNGSYAFVFHGLTNGSLAPTAGQVYGVDAVGSLAFDGVSKVTGTVDFNGALGTQSAIPVTGTYQVNPGQRGKIMLIVAGNNTLALDIAVTGLNNGVANKFRFVEADTDNPADPTEVQGTGEAFLQTASAFSTSALNGNFVFRMEGETPANTSQFGALSAVGYLGLNGSTTIASGSMDAQGYTAASLQLGLTGSLTAPNSQGRGTMVIQPSGTGFQNQPVNYVYYVVNANQIVLLSTDAHNTSSLVAGIAFKQQQASYSTSSLSGTLIGWESAVYGGDGTTTFPSSLAAFLYNFKVTGPGTMMGYTAWNEAGSVGTYVDLPDHITYSVAANGRVTMTDLDAPAGTQLPVFWLYDTNKAVGTDVHSGTTGSIGSIDLEGQVAKTAFADADVQGVYAVGTVPQYLPVTFTSGSLDANNNSVGIFVTNTTNNGVVQEDVIASTRKAVESATGRVTFIVGTNTNYTLFYNGFIISPTKVVYFSAFKGDTKPQIIVAEQ